MAKAEQIKLDASLITWREAMVGKMESVLVALEKKLAEKTEPPPKLEHLKSTLRIVTEAYDHATKALSEIRKSEMQYIFATSGHLTRSTALEVSYARFNDSLTECFHDAIRALSVE